jgi:hypothetical protein
MHPETTIRLANMRRDDLLRSARPVTVETRRTRPTRKFSLEGARS